MSSGTLGGSSALMWNVVSKPRKYWTTRERALLLGRGFEHGRYSNDGLFLGDPPSSNLIREETTICMSSRRFPSDNVGLPSLSGETLFRRKNSVELGIYEDLPSPPAIKFSSPEGELLYTEASREGNLKDFLGLLNAYEALSEPGFYGMASISTVLNALEVNPGRKWKSRWRWFYEYLLDCCDSFEKIKAEGITFGKLAFLAHRNGAKVEVFQTNQCTIDDFRQYVMKCASSKDYYMITHYDRTHLNQNGGSHISPIGGYHAGRDLVLIMDVARFKYPPHWVPLTLLWKAMDTIDEVTGHHKWFMVLSRLPYDPCVLYTLCCRDESWISTANYLTRLPFLLKSEEIKDICQVLSVVFTSCTTNFVEFIKKVAEVDSPEGEITNLSRYEKKRLAAQKELLQQVQETDLFKYVNKWLHSAYFENFPSFSSKYTSPDTMVNFSCQDVNNLSCNPGSSARSYNMDTNAESLKSNNEILTTVLYGPVVASTAGQGSSAMVQSTHEGGSRLVKNGIQMHLPSDDTLTVLLLALPPHTWSGIKEMELLTNINNLVSIDNVPRLLKNEVLSLRQQLQLLLIDLGSPST